MSSGPVDSSGVIHGCYTNTALNGSHVFVLQDAGTNCPRGTTPISWNQAPSPGIDGGTVEFQNSGSGNTCSTESSFGPDQVTVAPTTVTTPSGVFGGCLLSGLPSGAGVVATAENFAVAGSGNTGQSAVLYPQSATSTAVVLAGPGPSTGDGGQFSWLAVPSS